MAHFEVAKGYEDAGINLPTRATSGSAGCDFEVAADTLIPPYDFQVTKLRDHIYENATVRDDDFFGLIKPFTLDQMAKFTKESKVKPVLVPTGIKCKLGDGEYLELSMRSSTPLKHWLVMANSIGIIDADYYGNPDNDGAIFFQIINLSPFAIKLKKGDKIGQGIIKNYIKPSDDSTTASRVGGFGSTTTDSEAPPW